MKLSKPANNFQLAPEGTTQGVVVDVVDMGMQEDRFNDGEFVHQVRVVFQTEDQTEEGVPFITSTYPVRASINSKAKLYGFIKTLLGRGLEEGDFDSDGEIDLDSLLIGKNANITIEHKTSGEKTYANVVGIGALTSKQQKSTLLEPRDYTRIQDRDDTSFNYGENAKADAAANI
jgi:hypothetical protein